MASIFSKIVSGDIPAAKVYEDDATLAFMDISPAARGHTLVISKAEYPDLFTIPPETLTAVMHTVQVLATALRDVLRCDGLNLIQNNGAAAGQAVFHFHVHLIPRWESDNAVRLWRPGSADPDDLRQLAAQISRAIVP